MSQLLRLLILSLGYMSDVEGSLAPEGCTGLPGDFGDLFGDHKPAWVSSRSQHPPEWPAQLKCFLDKLLLII